MPKQRVYSRDWTAETVYTQLRRFCTNADASMTQAVKVAIESDIPLPTIYVKVTGDMRVQIVEILRGQALVDALCAVMRERKTIGDQDGKQAIYDNAACQVVFCEFIPQGFDDLLRAVAAPTSTVDPYDFQI